MDNLPRRAYGRGMDQWDAEIDAVGLLCPLPVLKAQKRLAALAPGAQIVAARVTSQDGTATAAIAEGDPA